MKIKYKLHEEYNKHYGCTCCEGGYTLLYDDYTLMGIEFCCDSMLKYYTNHVDFDKGKIGHIMNDDKDYENELLEYLYCPFCGEKIESVCISHIRDIPEFEKKMVERTRTIKTEEKYMVEKEVLINLKQEIIIQEGDTDESK